MKKIFGLILSITLLATLASFKIVDQPFEGDINFKINYIEVPEDMKGMESMLPSQLSMTFGEGKAKIQQDVMGGSQIIITDDVKKEGDMLMEMMGMKIHVHMTKEELEKEEADMEKPTVKLLSGEKKILGYTCKRAEVVTSEGSMELWYTNEIDAKNKDFKEIDGFPLEYTANQGGLKMQFIAASVESRKVDLAEFAVPSGYTTYTLAELSQMFGGGN
ncbi:MAG TPA: DUF4412 domain-containing protein [Roseivirga sp.]